MDLQESKVLILTTQQVPSETWALGRAMPFFIYGKKGPASSVGTKKGFEWSKRELSGYVATVSTAGHDMAFQHGQIWTLLKLREGRLCIVFCPASQCLAHST
jgi:hypothetical protein